MEDKLDLVDWASKHLDPVLLSGELPSLVGSLQDVLWKSVGHHLQESKYGSLALMANGYAWSIPASFATLTSANMKMWVDKKHKEGVPLVFDFDGLRWAHPFVVEHIRIFWYGLEVNIAKPQSLQQPQIVPDNAAELSVSITTLMALIFLYDAATHLDDSLLEATTLNALHGRLLHGSFTDPEFIEAVEEVYKREKKNDATKTLHSAFLTAAVIHFERFIVGAHRADFLDLQCMPDFGYNHSYGLCWYMGHYVGRKDD
ncbi:uncharacterized protein N0V89_001383 [Didymosphaeria variabile]|uniref:Terpenoid synthase n=1 Tax=Didymosphaeria variabile TaxID=1932322 RepID=A0A9W9CGR9_9PLEO|nr:uncharacterized protein N0V89_001383 [Didymosphaeria variabile]KAJ4360816.1 hypothetical protein N0V89_001383 [Didymosphaeria variabile]